jgi:hypothetical protein
VIDILPRVNASHHTLVQNNDDGGFAQREIMGSGADKGKERSVMQVL